MLSTLAPNAGQSGTSKTRHTKTWLATYSDKAEFNAAWLEMANTLVAKILTNEYGVYGRKELRGYTLYLVTYGTANNGSET